MAVRSIQLNPEVLQSLGVRRPSAAARAPTDDRYSTFELPPEYRRALSGSFTSALVTSIKQRFREPVQMFRELATGESPAILEDVRSGRKAVARAVAPRSYLEQQAIGGASSAAMLPFAIASRVLGRLPGGAAASMTLAGAPAYFDRRLQRESIGKSLSNAFAQGAIEAAGDLFAFAPIFKNKSVAQRGLDFVLRNVASEIGEEQAQNLADKLHDVNWNRPDWRDELTAKLVEWGKEAPELARDTVAQTLIAGGAASAVIPQHTVSHARRPSNVTSHIATQIAQRRAPDITEWTLANGGATWDVRRNKPVKAGYAVGAHPDRTRVLDRDLTPDDVRQYIEDNYDLLTKPNKFIGTWVDQQSGSTYLDVTTVLPREAAIDLARKNGEKAIFDLKNKQEIRLDDVERNPASDLIAKLKALESPSRKAGAISLVRPEPVQAEIQQDTAASRAFGVTTISEAMFIDPTGRGLGRGGLSAVRDTHEQMLSWLHGKRIAAGDPMFAKVAAQHGLIRVRRDVAEFFVRPTPKQIEALAERLAGMQQAILAYSPPGRASRSLRISDTTSAGIRRAIDKLIREESLQ